jgi:hypothetical protein
MSGPGERALAKAVRDLAAGRPGSAAEIAAFGVTLVVVPADAGGALARIARVPGLARVPATATVVYQTAVPAGELSVLDPVQAAAAPTAGGPRTPPALLPAANGHADTQLPAGPDGRLLVLAEPYSSGWRASVGGHVLPAMRAYGWAQAWTLPAGGGRLVVERTGGGRGAWVDGEAALLALALLLCVPAGRLRRSSAAADDAADDPADDGAAQPEDTEAVHS